MARSPAPLSAARFLPAASAALLLLAAPPAATGLFVSWPGTAVAQAAEGAGFVAGITDLPLMAGLAAVQDETMVFDKPAGRIVQAVARGRVDRTAVRAFYAGTLPQLGWKRVAENRFVREGEVLALELFDGTGQTTVRFVLSPQR